MPFASLRTAHFAVCLIITASAFAQTGNFDETWKEFLENKSISNTSALVRPDPRTDLDDHAKYVLMNLNNAFCQSKLDKAEQWRDELARIDAEAYTSIPGFVARYEDIKSKMTMGERVDAVWRDFLDKRSVDPADLRALDGGGSSCEKQTLAKYSFLQAHTNLCQGEVALARRIFEKRTLQLAEKTSLRVADVPGLAPEVAQMKTYFRTLPRLGQAWKNYVDTGVSPGWDEELPLYPCYPEPNIKALILRGAADACGAAPQVIAEIEQLRSESGATIDDALAAHLTALEGTVADQRSARATLDKAWAAFLPDNEVPTNLKYGHDYCEKLPLIRAYIMDGFAFVCETAEVSLDQIAELQSEKPAKLDAATKEKIEDLKALLQAYLDNGERIDGLWNEFVSQGDTLYADYYSSTDYCDRIQQVKDWTMRGLLGDCESPDFYQSVEKIDFFQESFTFQFYEELDCRVQKLRRRAYDCRYEILYTLAELDEESEEPLDARIAALLAEHEMGERPALCD